MSNPAIEFDLSDLIASRAADAIVAARAARAANDNEEGQRPDVECRSDSKLADLTRPGGFVEELIDWIVASAEHPSRELALSAVLPFIGALIGRRFSGYRDARSNLYAIALAPSGFGKDHARQQIKRLTQSAGLHAFAGPARIMSASALRNALNDKPSMNCQIDEVGGLLREILDPRAGAHQAALKGDLLEFFTSASTFFDGAAYAQARAVQIHAPNLSIYGTSTPDDFWNAVSTLSTRDGFIARLLLFSIAETKSAAVIPALDVKDVTPRIRDAARALAMAGRAGPTDIPASDTGSIPREARDVGMSEGAERRRRDFKADIESRLPKADGADKTILGRAVEHAVKLALIVAVATNPADPEITEQNMAWAVQLSWLSCCALMREARLNVSDGTREAAFNKALRTIGDAGDAGITAGRLTDKLRSLDKRQRTEILDDLVETRRVERVRDDAGKRGGPSTWRYFLA
ncbi:hypothetical protein [Bosea sp. (in: a-proteobacteria)]|uniref:hypothetical protein n=1 Tax=Bosea sp. (in: a-proteobacteria) TaxID=1871050 RepID=UPI002732FDE2|nr:hypothetical protein [Bosea sp. (in: a-proteobacteria)]MDP3257827.1 hypothetical protein [Bosea sp. (in: a-proteobacteria)]